MSSSGASFPPIGSVGEAYSTAPSQRVSVSSVAELRAKIQTAVDNEQIFLRAIICVERGDVPSAEKEISRMQIHFPSEAKATRESCMQFLQDALRSVKTGKIELDRQLTQLENLQPEKPEQRRVEIQTTGHGRPGTRSVSNAHALVTALPTLAVLAQGAREALYDVRSSGLFSSETFTTILGMAGVASVVGTGAFWAFRGAQNLFIKKEPAPNISPPSPPPALAQEPSSLVPISESKIEKSEALTTEKPLKIQRAPKKAVKDKRIRGIVTAALELKGEKGLATRAERAANRAAVKKIVEKAHEAIQPEEDSIK